MSAQIKLNESTTQKLLYNKKRSWGESRYR